MTEIVLDQFAGQSWLITPAALAVGESPHETILDQEWLLVPSGGGGKPAREQQRKGNRDFPSQQ